MHFRTSGHIGKFSEVDFLEFELDSSSYGYEEKPSFWFLGLEEALHKRGLLAQSDCVSRTGFS